MSDEPTKIALKEWPKVYSLPEFPSEIKQNLDTVMDGKLKLIKKEKLGIVKCLKTQLLELTE